jgi:hypothetical protein
MPTLDITVECPVYDSFRVQQVAGMFDVPLAARAAERFYVEVPEEIVGRSSLAVRRSNVVPNSSSANDKRQSTSIPWRIGLIVGPSGSGKSTIAKRLFGDAIYRRSDWPENAAVIDGLGDHPTKEITSLFTAVGFSSPPSWIKPYRVLSNGEQFRCDLARALLEGGKDVDRLSSVVDRSNNDATGSSTNAQRSTTNESLVVFDEFTSVVDRNVARVVSAAVAKGIQSGRIGCRFVAVTCHYDVTQWLQPNWIIDMATSTFHGRFLRRPPIQLEIVRSTREAWRLFARHHYLSGKLSEFAQCHLALWDGAPTAFCATLPLIGGKNRRRITRLVTLPD